MTLSQVCFRRANDAGFGGHGVHAGGSDAPARVRVEVPDRRARTHRLHNRFGTAVPTAGTLGVRDPDSSFCPVHRRRPGVVPEISLIELEPGIVKHGSRRVPSAPSTARAYRSGRPAGSPSRRRGEGLPDRSVRAVIPPKKPAGIASPGSRTRISGSSWRIMCCPPDSAWRAIAGITETVAGNRRAVGTRRRVRTSCAPGRDRAGALRWRIGLVREAIERERRDWS